MFRPILFSATLTTSAMALGAATVPAGAAAPYAKPNNSWVALSGEVASVSDTSFQFDYGEGLITVEMDDWDWYDEANQLRAGEHVTIYGKIDDDLFELSKIEAASVYARERDTYYYSNPTDEELREGTALYFPNYTNYPTAAPEGTTITVSGTVQKIDGRELTLDTGPADVQIDTASMLYNPLDTTGYQQIGKDDVVRVTGEVDADFFEKREVIADAIMSVYDDRDGMGQADSG